MNLLLLGSLVILIIGPLLHTLLKGRKEWFRILDGFNFVAISGLIFLSIIPAALERGGPTIFIFAFLGILGPTFLERRSRSIGRESHFWALMLGLFGLAFHAIFDGAALAGVESHDHPHLPGQEGHSHDHAHLPIAVLLHRLPVGLTIWLLLKPKYGNLKASLVLATVGVTTIIGFFAGDHFLTQLPAWGLSCFEALVGGSLIHVVLHRTTHDEPLMLGMPEKPFVKYSEGIGGLIGVALLGWLFSEGGLLLELGEMGDKIVHEFIHLSLASAPALLLGYLLSGILDGFLPVASVRWMAKGKSLGQSVRGMVLGLPLPVCSCGVVPLYKTLVQRGAPATAAMAFMIATPELGLDALLLSFPLLGFEMTMWRLGASAFVALLIGFVVGGYTKKLLEKSDEKLENTDVNKPLNDPSKGSIKTRLKRIFTFGLGELVDHTGPWILLGIAIAAVVSPLIDQEAIATWPPAFMVILLALAGIPTYVCASGATPFVAMLVVHGVSPGAGLAFLLTGPATNATTFGVIGKLHGKKVAMLFSGLIIVVSIAIGIGVDVFFPFTAGVTEGEGGHVHGGTTIQLFCLSILIVVYIAALLRNGPRKFLGEVIQTGAEHDGHSHSHSHQSPSDKKSCCH